MTWIQTATGIAFDLIDPRPEMVDFEVDIAESLARQPRFTGHIRSGSYSVAQHCVLGADALLRETGRTEIAAAFLLHDAHEAYVGDMATPVSHALAAYAGACAAGNTMLRSDAGFDPKKAYAEGKRCAYAGLKALKDNVDTAIHAAAGIAWPLPDDVRAAVKEMDLRMLSTERRHLLGPSPRPWGEDIESARPVRLNGKLTVWPWPDAADAWRDRLRRYLPHLTPPARLNRPRPSAA
ncbi:MAG: hypothetical protein LCH39_01895 [Proteobacteria bacterium]|nr:hypothetical protein [Pseudomonadota bacterium]